MYRLIFCAPMPVGWTLQYFLQKSKADCLVSASNKSTKNVLCRIDMHNHKSKLAKHKVKACICSFHQSAGETRVQMSVPWKATHTSDNSENKPRLRCQRLRVMLVAWCHLNVWLGDLCIQPVCATFRCYVIYSSCCCTATQETVCTTTVTNVSPPVLFRKVLLHSTLYSST